METCPVCGRTYGVTHDCLGPPAAESLPTGKWIPPSGFAPLHYFRQALAIACLDDGAVVAASRDKNAILYGGFIWVLGQTLVIGSVSWVGGTGALSGIVVLFVILFLTVLDAVLILGQVGLCHLLARWWFGARGTYAGLLRPLLLGSVVFWLAAIPYIGVFAASIWSIAVMMIVFENVDGIGRLKAFGLSLVIGLIFQALSRGLLVQH